MKLNIYKRSLVFFAVIASILAINFTAYASAPNLTVSQSGSNVIISISNASANSTVSLFQRQSSQFWSQISSLGQTDSNGNFSITVPQSWDGSTNPIQFYVLVANAQSSTVQLYPNSQSSQNLSLSQNNLTLNSGQSSTVTAYPSSGNVYVSSNSNSSIISYSLAGNQITIYGIQSGNSTLSVCINTNVCSNIAVTVNGSSTSTNTFAVSPNSLSIQIGQNSTAAVLNSTGTIYISSNSSSAVASAGLSGQTVTVYGITSGNTTINICQNGNNSCVNLYVTVGSSAPNSGSGLTFGSPSVQLSVGQNQDITSIISPAGNPSGNNNNFYISSNINPAIATASIDGNFLKINALTVGSTTIIICQNGYNYCGSVFVTIGGLSGAINFSQNSINLTQGQTSNISVSGGSGSYYISNNSNSSVASGAFSSNILTVTGLSNGSTTLTICQTSSTNSCGTVAINVGINSGTLTFSNSSSITVGQSEVVVIYSPNNFTGNYSITGNSNSGVASATLSGSTLNISGISSGSSYLTICESGTAICGNLTVNVNNQIGSTGPLTFSSTSLPAVSAGQYYSYQLQALGGTGSYQFSISNGILPAGLSMTPAGLISGTPTTSSGTSFTVFLVDSSGTGTAGNLTIPSGNNISTTPAPTPSTTNTTPNPTTTTSSNYNNGQLINEGGTIYIVYKNTKTPFSNSGAFLGLGFKFQNIISTSNSGLIASGIIVVTKYGKHPRGSWIQNGSTIYLVTENGLIPVPDWNTFLNNGGQAGYIVKANNYDLAFTKLSPMTLNDSRIH